MKRRSLHLLLAGLLLPIPATRLHAANDGGGKDVSVSLFSAHPAQHITMTAVGPSAWMASCASCPHVPLNKPFALAPGSEIFAGGTLRVTDDTLKESRTATGLWHLKAGRPGSPVDVVLTLPSERYVAAVLNAEAAHDEPQQSMHALAVVVRTYALNGRHYKAPPGHLDADLCDSTECQAMSLQPASSAVEEAVRATAGETLWMGAQRAEVYFSQSCGGVTEDASVVWPNLKNVPYLHSHTDPYCERRTSSNWHAQIPLQKLFEVARAEGWHIPLDLAEVRVTQRSASQRAVRVAFFGRDGTAVTLRATNIRFGIGRTLGWNLVRSDNYRLALQGGSLQFDGRGHGHGVGLCQVGAAEMAAEGKSAADILSFYFPGTTLRINPSDTGWKEVRTNSLLIRSAQTISAQQQSALDQLWNDTQRRFKPAHPVTPTVVFAPSTEIFRQFADQPGWSLAGTRGDTAVLQPATVFHAPATVEQTLRHELLHIAVETACNDLTPLWLREGLVEVLSGDKLRTVPPMPTSEIDAALRHATTRQESEAAHMAAATRVQFLLNRYGASVVRGWLSTGVPASVLER